MRRQLIRWAAVVGLLGAAAAGAFYLFVWFSGGTGEASEPISAPRLELPTTTATLEAVAPTASAAAASTATATAGADTPAPTETLAPEPTAADSPAPDPTATATAARDTPTPEPTAAPTEATSASSAVPTTTVLYRIVPDESQARFEINEVLRGEPTHVVGTTDQVAGDFIVDFADMEASQLGTIRINVRTLRSPEERRDRAIRSQILQSARDEYEFTDFVPVALVGLPESVAMGRPESFQIIGNLTIRDITHEVTFNAELTLVTADRVEGTAVTTIQRGDYELTIPSVPFVAEVGEDVILGIDFVAIAVAA